MALFFLYFFRIAAITVYLISGWFGDSYVLTVRFVSYPLMAFTFIPIQTVIVVVLLAMDFWNCRVRYLFLRPRSTQVLVFQNVSGRTLVGLRFWNQVDEDGESYWVFENRDVRIHNSQSPTDSSTNMRSLQDPQTQQIQSTVEMAILFQKTNSYRSLAVIITGCFGFVSSTLPVEHMYSGPLQVALYTFPALWIALLIVLLLKLRVECVSLRLSSKQRFF